MTTDTVINVENLNVTYGTFHAVKDLSFSVRRGELYALLGTNGAGKTSTLEVIEGHRAASSGTVEVFGQQPSNRRAVRPRTGIMLQESGFSPELTALETVALIGHLTKREDRPERVLDVVGLSGKARTQVGQMSGGEKRRLDFATAIYGEPELIFLDEPTTGLDIQSRDSLWEAVERMRENGTSVVLTTHYLEEAQQHADRIGLMHEGAFRMEGTVAELTRTLPSVIQFSLPADAPLPPVTALPAAHGKLIVETHELQRDLHLLLTWAHDRDLTLDELEAAPTRLDSVFRSITNA